jgi:hypothetical protein
LSSLRVALCCPALYAQEPQRHPDFAYFFGPEWAASVVLSLRNAVSVVFQHTPRPALLQFDILRLQLEQLRTPQAPHINRCRVCGGCVWGSRAHPFATPPQLWRSPMIVCMVWSMNCCWVCRAHAQIASLEAEHAHMVAESAAVQVCTALRFCCTPFSFPTLARPSLSTGLLCCVLVAVLPCPALPCGRTCRQS